MSLDVLTSLSMAMVPTLICQAVVLEKNRIARLVKPFSDNKTARVMLRSPMAYG